jgi:hypothetical protein
MRRKASPTTTAIANDDMILVRALRGACLGKAWQVLDDATIHIHWWNGINGRRLQPSAKVFPAYLDESTKLREVFTTNPSKDQALQPVWGIIALRQVIGQPFTLQERKLDHWYLPNAAKTAIADWLRPTPATLFKKKSNNKASIIKIGALRADSTANWKCSPPCRR